jgi:hypothetical protein
LTASSKVRTIICGVSCGARPPGMPRPSAEQKHSGNLRGKKDR